MTRAGHQPHRHDGPVSTGGHDAHLTREHRDHHRRHVATWAAAVGTLLVIVALWAVLLPSMLAGNTRVAGAGASAAKGDSPTFQQAMDSMRQSLDGYEIARQDQSREQAAAAQAEKLRAQIEAAGAAPAAGAAGSDGTNVAAGTSATSAADTHGKSSTSQPKPKTP